MKTCSRCKATKPESEFYSDKRTPDGLKAQCKPCHTEGNVRTRDPAVRAATNRVHMRRARAAEPEKFRTREREASRKRPKNEKTRARALLNNAVKAGRRVRPTHCSRCGLPRKVTGHHPDYSKPLDVEWLCYECHANE